MGVRWPRPKKAERVVRPPPKLTHVFGMTSAPARDFAERWRICAFGERR
jgi:hypothetical protein